ncbi:MAG: response regulator [Candidatus Gygaella obscura]|nr:response regulator [Candidatus Gygaella obscura]
MAKILVVDDEIELVAAIKIRLQAQGFEVITAIDGDDGLRKARLTNPDLIIMDLMMPKRDGYTVCKMLKFDQKFRNIPIIILSARSQEKDKKLGEEVGSNAYITKPFETEALIEKVKELLNK